jgi:hypothetical protein
MTESGGGHSCYDGVGCGTVFELAPSARGDWNEKIVHDFDGNDGANPWNGLVFDSTGDLYGETSGGRKFCQGCGCGVVFKLTPAQGGGWTEAVLHQFNGNDGQCPVGAPVLDSEGNLYGATWTGPGYGSGGTIFEVSP